MQTTVKKWGNSYAIRVPKHIIEDLNMKQDSVLDMVVEDNQIVLTHNKKEQELKKLLRGVNRQKEIDWGDARGKESW